MIFFLVELTFSNIRRRTRVGTISLSDSCFLFLLFFFFNCPLNTDFVGLITYQRFFIFRSSGVTRNSRCIILIYVPTYVYCYYVVIFFLLIYISYFYTCKIHEKKKLKNTYPVNFTSKRNLTLPFPYYTYTETLESKKKKKIHFLLVRNNKCFSSMIVVLDSLC